MTPLGDILTRQIARTGPMTLADYMSACLLHPDHGYYATRDPLGVAGDFTTAPEISQMFGEMIGLALAQSWMDQGQPVGVLVELGPGRGTLMADILRATKGVPGFHAALTVYLVEASPALRGIQAKAVPQAHHVRSLDEVPEAPLFLIANEFFDALPIRQFIRSGDGWAERVVGLTDGYLSFGLTAPTRLNMLEHRWDTTAEGDMIEHCPALPGLAEEIGRRVEQSGGAALLIDYGHWNATGDTFQAVQRHSRADPLDTPGEADLTAHMDFAAIAAAVPCGATALTKQGVFLEHLGITQRAQALANRLQGKARAAHVAAHRRLVHPDEMGELFQIIGLYPAAGPVPPGLDP